MPQQVTRLILVFAIFIGIFYTVRSYFVPESWGEFGHYRGNAIREIAALETKYADIKTCIECHKENAGLLAEGEHASIKCQTCHGPGYKHNKYYELQGKSNTPDSASMSTEITDTSVSTENTDTSIQKHKSTTPEEFRLRTPDDRKFCLNCHELNSGRPEKAIKQIDVTDHYNMKKKCIKCHPPHAPNS
ncbi:MAG: hypothetical protein HYY40_08350 [Bacteroidetes bacterium]|nr:hypothetical protein [Bacteroidota bacterium]